MKNQKCEICSKTLGKYGVKYCSVECSYDKNSSRNKTIGLQKKGKTFTEMYGEKKSQKLRNQMSERMKKFVFTPERNKKISLSRTGKKRSKETCMKMSKGMKGLLVGEKNGNWKGGITSLGYTIRESPENKEWQISCLKKQGSKCIICKSKKNIEIHHINSLSYLIQKYKINKNNWVNYQNILFDIKNGLILCNKHHNADNGISLHSIYGRKNISKKHLNEYLYNTI